MNRKLFWLTIFAIAMALLEAAVVVYLRQLYYPADIQHIFPIAFANSLDVVVELSREVATVIMMLSVAFLAEKKDPTRIFAAFVYQFGVWDIFYYLWLKVFIGWPLTLLGWDILFLIPWIWLGPWICPVLIALLFVVWGGIVLSSSRDLKLRSSDTWIFIAGAVLGLISFLQPGLKVMLTSGLEGFSHYRPGGFWWWLFIPGYLLMILGLGRSLIRTTNPAPRINQPQTPA